MYLCLTSDHAVINFVRETESLVARRRAARPHEAKRTASATSTALNRTHSLHSPQTTVTHVTYHLPDSGLQTPETRESPPCADHKDKQLDTHFLPRTGIRAAAGAVFGCAPRSHLIHTNHAKSPAFPHHNDALTCITVDAHTLTRLGSSQLSKMLSSSTCEGAFLLAPLRRLAECGIPSQAEPTACYELKSDLRGECPIDRSEQSRRRRRQMRGLAAT